MGEDIVKEYITIPKGGRPKKEVSERFKELAHKYTIKELASQFGVSTATVYRWLKESGIKKYGKDKNSSRPIQEIPEELDKLAKEFTIKELAERFNTSTATISRWMREKGIKKREEKATVIISIEEYNRLKALASDDAISRKEILSYSTTIQDRDSDEYLEVVDVDDIKDLSPIYATQKTGTWIKITPLGDTWQCSKCKKNIYNIYQKDLYPFCPYCSSKNTCKET